jgi:hypothetical protein
MAKQAHEHHEAQAMKPPSIVGLVRANARRLTAGPVHNQAPNALDQLKTRTPRPTASGSRRDVGQPHPEHDDPHPRVVRMHDEIAPNTTFEDRAGRAKAGDERNCRGRKRGTRLSRARRITGRSGDRRPCSARAKIPSSTWSPERRSTRKQHVPEQCTSSCASAIGTATQQL